MEKKEDNEPKQSAYLRKGYRGFIPGNPGRPVGALSKTTRLKNEVLEILNTRKEELKNMPIDKLLTVGATFVPKEKVEKETEGEKIIVVVNNARDGKNSRAPLRSASEPTEDKG